MHNHDQGIEPGCKWCDLDLLLHDLAAEVGLTDLNHYLVVELRSMFREKSLRDHDMAAPCTCPDY